MSDALVKDEVGFLRGRKYARISRKKIAEMLDAQSDEQIYVSGVERGVRTAKPVDSKAEVHVKPGDTFSLGPRIVKAAEALEMQLKKEADALKRSGFGSASPPVKKDWGWEIEIKGMTLPGGARTDVMVLVPNNYPLVSPIGFYVKKGAVTGTLDVSHLYPDRVYHNAVDLSKEGWQWFCGVTKDWKPGRYTLVNYVTQVLCFFNERVEQ